MTVIVSDEAVADIIRTSNYYDTKPGRYGVAFEDEVERAIQKISEMPRVYSLVEDGVAGREYREYFITRFRQRVIFEVKDEIVRIVAVIHAASREGTWHRNIDTSL